MKTISSFIYLFLIFIFFLIGNNGIAQTSSPVDPCIEIKKENDFLKKTLKINEPIKIYDGDDLEIKLVKATGNIKTQIIKLEYLVINKSKIRNIGFNAAMSQFISLSGDLIPVSKEYSISDIQLTTDVPIRTSIEIGTILPENKILKLVTVRYFITYPGGVAEFRDVPIEWK